MKLFLVSALWAVIMPAMVKGDAVLVDPVEPDGAAKLELYENQPSTRHLADVEHSGLRHLTEANADEICTGSTDGVIPDGGVCTPSDWDFYEFYLRAGIQYSIAVNRVDCDLDPALVLYKGIVSGTLPSFQCFYDETDLGGATFLGYADDNNGLPDACSGTGPWADPLIYVTPTSSGYYTLAVVEYESVGSGPFEYEIEMSPPPGEVAAVKYFYEQDEVTASLGGAHICGTDIEKTNIEAVVNGCTDKVKFRLYEFNGSGYNTLIKQHQENNPRWLMCGNVDDTLGICRGLLAPDNHYKLEITLSPSDGGLQTDIYFDTDCP